MDRRIFQLHRNEYWNNSETLIKIEWSSMFRVLKGNIELTNFTEYKLNLFKKYPIYFKDKEIYLHLWKCEYLEQVYLNMIDKFQQYLQELILVNSQMENANSDDIFKEISCCKIWDFNKTYNLSILIKGFIHIDLVNLFKSYKILDKDRIRLLDVKRFFASENSHSEGVDAAFGEGEVKKEVNGLYLEDPFRLKLYLDNVNSKKLLSGYLLLTGYPLIQPDLLYPDINTTSRSKPDR
ncbi:hypothetical protein RhiirB3_437838 [Rhizophagus irregularis]|nr:hypothetical protein RhiirB3_437838 [Rhizophagus irregularis]